MIRFRHFLASGYVVAALSFPSAARPNVFYGTGGAGPGAATCYIGNNDPDDYDDIDLRAMQAAWCQIGGYSNGPGPIVWIGPGQTGVSPVTAWHPAPECGQYYYANGQVFAHYDPWGGAYATPTLYLSGCSS